MLTIMTLQLPVIYKICIDSHNRVVPFRKEGDDWRELGRYRTYTEARKRIQANMTGKTNGS